MYAPVWAALLGNRVALSPCQLIPAVQSDLPKLGGCGWGSFVYSHSKWQRPRQ